MKQQTVTTYMLGSSLNGLARVPLNQNCAVIAAVQDPLDASFLVDDEISAVVIPTETVRQVSIETAEKFVAKINDLLEAAGKPKLKTVVYGGVL